jgi:hypothetical protein
MTEAVSSQGALCSPEISSGQVKGSSRRPASTYRSITEFILGI